MKRTGPLRRKTPMRRTPIKHSKPKNPGFTRATKNAALERSGGRCEADTPACDGRVDHYHHRRLRSQGGPNTLANALAVCSACHTYIHLHPAMSMKRGWIIGAFAGHGEPPDSSM